MAQENKMIVAPSTTTASIAASPHATRLVFAITRLPLHCSAAEGWRASGSGRVRAAGGLRGQGGAVRARGEAGGPAGVVGNAGYAGLAPRPHGATLPP